MMTQEEYMKVKALRAAGWTISQIAKHLGYHPSTISGWLRNGGPPEKRVTPAEDLVLDERWQRRVAELLEHNSDLLGTSIYRVIAAEGYDGSYPTLTRHLRFVRGPRRGHVQLTMPIETTPGEEFQFDWSDCNRWARRWGWDHELHCFGCVLCWSRRKFWWFADSIEQAETLEGLVSFFEDIDGIPAVGRTDRMGQLGRSRGKAFVLHPVTKTFCRHYDFAFKACDAGDAKRKGKIERPFRDLKAGFLPEMDLDPPADIAELNRRAARWLHVYFHPVPHGTTGVAPAERFVTEQALLGRLPSVRFDTAARDARRVGRVPLVEWGGVFYSAPPELAGKMVEARQPVAEHRLELRFLGRLVAVHELTPLGSPPQWLAEHKQRAEAIILSRKRLALVDEPVNTVHSVTNGVELEDGDYDVDVPDLAALGRIGPHPDIGGPVDIAADGTPAGGGGEK